MRLPALPFRLSRRRHSPSRCFMGAAVAGIFEALGAADDVPPGPVCRCTCRVCRIRHRGSWEYRHDWHPVYGSGWRYVYHPRAAGEFLRRPT